MAAFCRCLRLLCLCVFGFVVGATGNRLHALDSRLIDLRERVASGARAIQSIEYTFRLESDDGFQTRVEVFLEENRFRVNREDIVGDVVSGKRLSPTGYSSAFDGRRQQLLSRGDKKLRLKDGPDGAVYGMETPQSLMYGWIASAGQTPRWDQILDPAAWTTRFDGATYFGRLDEGGVGFEVVDFPQREGVKTPCFFRVYFASELGYVPLRYDRYIESSKEIASWVRVVRHQTLDFDGRSLAVPLEVQFEQNDKDLVGAPLKWRLVVDEPSLKVNQDVDDSRFAIVAGKDYEANDYEVNDVDEFQRIVRKAEEAYRGHQVGELQPRTAWSYWLLWLNLAAILALALFAILRGRRIRTK